VSWLTRCKTYESYNSGEL